jgi:ribosomal protein L17
MEKIIASLDKLRKQKTELEKKITAEEKNLIAACKAALKAVPAKTAVKKLVKKPVKK